MTHTKNIRAYVRPFGTYTEEKQRDMIAQAAGKIGLPVSIYVEGKQSRDAWIRALRKDEVALVARLDVIAAPKREGVRPLMDFAKAIAVLSNNCAYVMEAESGAKSEDKKRWEALVDATVGILASGRRLTTREARRMARKRHAKAPPGAARRLKADPEFQRRWGPVWRDPAFENGAAALAALPDEINSLSMAYRVLGDRRPGDRKAGGRPKRKLKR